MSKPELAKSSHAVHIRRSRPADLDALWDLENQVFETDRMSRRSLQRILASPSAVALVAEAAGATVGAAIVLFRANSRLARLYSLAVAPNHTGRGIAMRKITAPSSATARPATTSSAATTPITRIAAMRCGSRSCCRASDMCGQHQDSS